MSLVVTRNNARFLMLKLEQTAAQSPDSMLQISQPSSEKEDAKSSKDKQPSKRCQKCLNENGKRARELHRGKPADSKVQNQVSKDGRIQQKDRSAQFNSVGGSRAQQEKIMNTTNRDFQ